LTSKFDLHSLASDAVPAQTFDEGDDGLALGPWASPIVEEAERGLPHRWIIPGIEAAHHHDPGSRVLLHQPAKPSTKTGCMCALREVKREDPIGRIGALDSRHQGAPCFAVPDRRQSVARDPRGARNSLPSERSRKNLETRFCNDA